jgi:predicted PurR-regulated permease PerM
VPAADDRPTVRAILRVVVTVVVSAAALYLLYLVREPISYLGLALFIAVAVSGPVASLSRHMKRGYAIAIVYLILIIAPVVIGFILVKPVVTSTVDLVNHLPEYAQDLEEEAATNETFRELNEDYNISGKLQERADDLVARVGDAAGAVVDIAGGIVNSLFTLVTILVLSMFMVARGRTWTNAALATRPPEQAAAGRRALDGMATAVGGYIGGALLQAVVAGVTSAVFLAILGVPSALALGVLMALFDLIPLVGATIGAVIVGVVVLFSGSVPDVVIWAIFAIAYQQFENYVIQPRIQSRASDLDPFIVVVAALFGGALLGIVGALLAIPIAAAIRVAVSEFMAFRRGEGMAGVAPDQLEFAEPAEPG